MTLDKANIFKLDETTELHEYKENPFFDCMPGAEKFAECLKCHVLTKPTPYVLLLEDHFGMGKTHFSTRFAYYLRECKIDAIYFSAWENDYIEQPFVSFSAEILKYFNKSQTVKKRNLKKTALSIKELILNLAKSTSTTYGINVFGNEISTNVNNKEAISAVEKFLNNFIERDDYLISFKKTLKSFIEELPNHKLVIIVDELDRCRPDYAMKTLEIIKHFFDVEGLFIIVPTNIRSLQRSVKALYGIDDENSSDTSYENYINKFFSDKLNMYKPDYLNLVKDLITEELIKELLDKNKMVLKDRYNSLAELQEKIAKFSEDCKLSIREVKKICEKALYICQYSNKNLYCEYIAYKLCEHETREKNNRFGISLESPLCNDIQSKKCELLHFSVPQEVYTINHIIHEHAFVRKYNVFRDQQISSYEKFEELYRYFCEAYSNGKLGIGEIYKFNILADYFEQKKNDIENYRKIWDSSDHDDDIRKYYDNIIGSEPFIHKELIKI